MEKNQELFKGNEEHLKLLLNAINKRKISAWNQWRSENNDLQVNLENAFLPQTDLSGADLHNTNLRNAFLAYSQLKNCNLREAVLEHAKMNNTNLNGSVLVKSFCNYVSLYDAKVENVDFTNAWLINASFHRSKCGYSIFDHSELDFCQFEMAVLSNTSFKYARAENINFYMNDLTSSDFYSSNLQKATIDMATLNSISFHKADLRGAKIVNSILDNVDFSEAIIGDLSVTASQCKNIKCNCVYWDYSKKRRYPMKGDFKENEFTTLLMKTKDLSDVFERGRMMQHVFISYVSEDLSEIEKIRNALENEGIKVWLDKYSLQPGVEWRASIENAIKNGVFFIACFSKSYVDKGKSYMNEELNIALEQIRLMPDGKTWFIPVKLDDCDIPEFRIRANKMLSDFQWVNLKSNWASGIKAIVEVIQEA